MKSDAFVCLIKLFALGFMGGAISSIPFITISIENDMNQEIYDYIKEHKECPFEFKNSIEIIDKRSKNG